MTALTALQRLKPVALALGVGLVLTGCAAELPEAGQPSEALYRARCGACHIPYRPGNLTPKMWESMVGLMDNEIRRARMKPLEGEEREAVLAYLRRNAAKQ